MTARATGVDRAARRAARAIRRTGERSTRFHSRELEYAIVRRPRPDLAAELTDANITVREGEDLVLGTWPDQYDINYGIKSGDTLVVQHMRNGDFCCVDIVSTASKTPPGRIRRWLFRHEWEVEDTQK